jgi:Tfp pilus assembly protein PilF
MSKEVGLEDEEVVLAIAVGLEDEEVVLAIAAASMEVPLYSRSMGATMLERLLAMAHRYLKAGSYRQATEMLWTLVDDHAGTLQAEAAKFELLKLAESYERDGKDHMARSMYERLMELED